MIEAAERHITFHPVEEAHLRADRAMMDMDARYTPEAYDRIQELMTEALNTRARSLGDLRYRIGTILAIMDQEDASDHAHSLVLAALADVDALAAHRG